MNRCSILRARNLGRCKVARVAWKEETRERVVYWEEMGDEADATDLVATASDVVTKVEKKVVEIEEEAVSEVVCTCTTLR